MQTVPLFSFLLLHSQFSFFLLLLCILFLSLYCYFLCIVRLWSYTLISLVPKLSIHECWNHWYLKVSVHVHMTWTQTTELDYYWVAYCNGLLCIRHGWLRWPTCTICDTCRPCYLYTEAIFFVLFFFAEFNICCAQLTQMPKYISRFGNFCVYNSNSNNNDYDDDNQLLYPCVCARGKDGDDFVMPNIEIHSTHANWVMRLKPLVSPHHILCWGTTYWTR